MKGLPGIVIVVFVQMYSDVVLGLKPESKEEHNPLKLLLTP